MRTISMLIASACSRLILALLLLLLSTNAWADSLVVMSGAGQSGLGGSAASQPIVVQARNVDGQVVAGRTINWTTSNGFILGASSSATDANGLASVTFTYGSPGTTAIVASDPAGATSAQALVTSTGSDSIILISGGGQSGKAGTTSAQPIVVEVRNASGNPVVGRSVGWSDQTSYTRVASPTSTTDSAGRASMTFTYLQGPAAVDGAVATIRATNTAGGQAVDATARVLGFDVLRMVSVQSQSGLVGSSGSPLTVQLTDWNGTPVAGATVIWYERLSSGLVSLSATSSVTDANGNTSITFQYVRPGTGEITAEYGPSATDMRFVSVGSDHMVLISPNNTYGAPGTHSTSPIVVEVRDVNNNPIPGRTIHWLTYIGDAVADAPTSVTDAAGRTSMGFTHGTVLSLISGHDPTILNATDPQPNWAADADTWSNPTNPANQNTFRMISGSGQTGLAGTAGAQPLVVEILDASGNPVVGVQVFYNISGNIVLDPAASFTDASGRASKNFTYGGPGQTMIQAARNFGTPSGTAAYVQFHVTATGIDTMMPISGNAQSGLVGTHSAQPLVTELRNASGQPVVGRTITWIVNGGNAVFDAPTSLTDASGRASMGFTFGPTASINGLEARDTTTGVHTGYFASGVGADAISQISGSGQTGLAGSAGAQPLVVEVRDAAGAPVTGRTIHWSTVTGDAVAASPASVTDGSGRASMTFTRGISPNSTLVATDSSTGQQVQFFIVASQAVGSGLIVSGNGQSGLPGTAGPQPIVIELRSPTNAPLPGQAVAWSVLSGPATLSAVSNITDAAGRASASFNFGATPGTSIIQARDVATGQLLQAAVTALGNNQALSVVSGDAQTLVANTTSEPLVVLLKNFANAPVVGATVSWTTSGGTLASATTVTDANGRSSNTVTTTVAGAVTVQANSVLAASPITFTLTTGLADLPNLTPEQEGVAEALDNACPALADLATLSPEQADLLARCQDLSAAAGINGGATAAALDELLADTAQAQSDTAAVAIGAQVQNVNMRLLALRSGSATSGTNGLTFTGPGGMIQLGSLMNALAGDEKSPQKAETFSRWGFFATGNIGRGEADANRSSPAYDYDISGVTAGIDYRQRDNLVIGAALGYTQQDTELAGSQGEVSMSGWSLSGYSTYSFKELWYVDGVVTVGSNQFELTRRISYTLPTPGGGTTSINQLATGKPDGDLFSTALTFGGDFHKGAFGFSPYGQLVYSRMGFDAYSETLRSGPGSGLGLAVESRDIRALTGILGARMTMTHSADWGVFAPTASFEWNHEFKDDPDAIAARLIYDPTNTLISITGEPMDSDYLRIGIGMSLVLTRGRSGFLMYQHMVARDGQSQDNLSLGLRIEF